MTLGILFLHFISHKKNELSALRRSGENTQNESEKKGWIKKIGKGTIKRREKNRKRKNGRNEKARRKSRRKIGREDWRLLEFPKQNTSWYSKSGHKRFCWRCVESIWLLPHWRKATRFISKGKTINWISLATRMVLSNGTSTGFGHRDWNKKRMRQVFNIVALSTFV